MHKKTIILLTLIATMALTAVPVLAIKPAGPSAKNGLEKGTNDHLYLYEKDPQDTEWPIVEEPAWAKININTKHGKFVCNAHQLEPDTTYALICYQDPWPGDRSLILGTGIADENGNVHIKGTIDYDTLPSSEYIINEGEEDEKTVDGSKIWLVLADDYDEDHMTGWNPTEYLFEFDLINQEIIS